MDELREYLLGVIATAVLCGILTKLINSKSTVGIAVKLTAGFVLLLSVVRPWLGFDIEYILAWTDSISQDGAHFVSEGEFAADESYRCVIKEQTQSYIEEEARALQCDVQVEVTLSSDPLAAPETVRLQGNVSPYVRQTLTALLTEKLGIDRGDIIWT